MSGNAAFLDTNVLVYAYSENDLRKKAISIQALNTYECIVSTQILNEFCSICIKKLHFPVAQIHKSIDEILDVCDLFVVNEQIAHAALDIHERYQASYFDSVHIASAIKCQCDLLLSEDLQDGQIINCTTIRNIYKADVAENYGRQK
jgi:predicted nucleic acid-binding protein